MPTVTDRTPQAVRPRNNSGNQCPWQASDAQAAQASGSALPTPIGPEGPGRSIAGSTATTNNCPSRSVAVFEPRRTGSHAPHPSPLRPPRPRRHPDCRADAPSGQPAPLPRPFGSGAPQQLSPRLLPRPLVLLDVGTPVSPARSSLGLLPKGPIELAGDDTVDRAPRQEGLRQGLPSRRRPLHTFLHRLPLGTQVGWCVAVLVRFPFFTRRLWALPIPWWRCTVPKTGTNGKANAGTRRPSELMRQLLAPVLIHWFPQRKFIFAGDGWAQGPHPLARFAHRHRSHVTLISRFYPDANLYVAHRQRSGANATVGRARRVASCPLLKRSWLRRPNGKS